MINAIVDTNVLLRGAISGSRRSPSKDLVNAYFAGRFLLVLGDCRDLVRQLDRQSMRHDGPIRCTGRVDASRVGAACLDEFVDQRGDEAHIVDGLVL